MYTRPNACYTIRMVSRCQENLGRMHWRFVKKIPRKLKGTLDYFLCYRSKELGLVGYSYADWTSDSNECKSISTCH